MTQFSKKTFLGLDLTPRRLMWARIARLEEQAGRFAADRELAFRLVAELDAKLRKLDQPRERGRFARKRVQPVAPIHSKADVPSAAWPSDVPVTGSSDDLVVRTVSDPDAEFSATRSCDLSAGAVATTSTVTVSDSPDDFVFGVCTNVPSENPEADFVSSAGDFPGLSCCDSSSSSVFDAPTVADAARCAVPADSLCPTCAAPASPSSPSGTPSVLLSFGSSPAETFKSRQLPS